MFPPLSHAKSSSTFPPLPSQSFLRPVWSPHRHPHLPSHSAPSISQNHLHRLQLPCAYAHGRCPVLLPSLTNLQPRRLETYPQVHPKCNLCRSRVKIFHKALRSGGTQSAAAAMLAGSVRPVSLPAYVTQPLLACPVVVEWSVTCSFKIK